VIEKDRYDPSTIVVRVPRGESWQESYVTVLVSYTKVPCQTAAC